MSPREDAKSADEFRMSAPTRVGTWIKEKYHLDAKLGEGGMAIVYSATHRNKKRFALKMLRSELSIEGDIKVRFLREGYVANTVEHPGVVAVLDDDVTEDGCAFLVMELLEGESVEELSDRRDGKLDARWVLVIAHRLLEVLVVAHAKNVVHRDLKPANLYVTKSGQLKVLDFGIARIRDSNLTNATNTGHAMGTPAFMGPEQARGKTSLIGPKTDLWAVGATMFTLLSTLNVHEGESAQEVVFQAASTPARSLASVMPKMPSAIVTIVDRALAFEPKDRWADAAEMHGAIADAYRSLYGTDISSADLADLLQPRIRIEASNPDLSVQGAAESAPTLAVPAPRAAATAASPAISVVVGRTTEQPVSSSMRRSIDAKRNRVALIAGGAIVVVAGVAAARFGVFSRNRGAVPVVASDTIMMTAPPPSASTQAPLASTTPTASEAASASSESMTASARASASASPKATSTHRATGGDKPKTTTRSSDFDRR